MNPYTSRIRRGVLTYEDIEVEGLSNVQYTLHLLSFCKLDITHSHT